MRKYFVDSAYILLKTQIGCNGINMFQVYSSLSDKRNFESLRTNHNSVIIVGESRDCGEYTIPVTIFRPQSDLMYLVLDIGNDIPEQEIVKKPKIAEYKGLHSLHIH